MPETRSNPALERIDLKLQALDIAILALETVRDRGEINADLANFRIDRLRDAKSDVLAEMDVILQTGTITNPPSPEQLEALRKRVTALHNVNVTAAALEGIIAESFAIAGAVGATRGGPGVRSAAWNGVAAAPKREAAADAPSLPMITAFAGGMLTAAALFAVTALIPRDRR